MEIGGKVTCDGRLEKSGRADWRGGGGKSGMGVRTWMTEKRKREGGSIVSGDWNRQVGERGNGIGEFARIRGSWREGVMRGGGGGGGYAR